MQDSQYNRGTSDNGQPLYSRNYPDTRCLPTSQPLYEMNTADNVIQVQEVSHACPHSLTAMPYFSHEQCNRDQPHETCSGSHGRLPQYHPCVGACCPCLPYLNNPFVPTCTNQGSIDRISHLSHKPMLSFTGSQNPSSSHPIRQETAPTHYGLSSSFVPSHQRTMPSQQMSNISIAVGDFQSQVSRTPRLSHVTTPESIFSAPQRPGSARNGPRGVDTPASTLSIGYRASMQKGTMSPAQMFPTQDRVSSGLGESSFNHNRVSELNGDDQDWLHNNDIHHAQPQTHHNLDTQEQHSNQHAIHPQAVNHGTGLRSSSQDSTFVPGQVSSGSTTNTGDDWDPVLGFQDFPIPPSFEDLNDEWFERKDGSFEINNQNAHPYQPSTSAYPQPFDFDTAHINDSAYGSGYANTPPTLPSNAFDLGHDGKNGAGGRGRQGIHDANKDALLVQMRREGKSYKEIMATKIFGLQESTLRGRYRTLTKNKEQRVRKPAWSQAAVAALVEGVEALAPPSAKRPRTKDALDKVPWKKVAEWMRDNKGCYHYGNATVKKKYQELLKEEQQRATGEIRKNLY